MPRAAARKPEDALRRALLGFAIGAGAGTALALAAGLLRGGDAIIDPLVQVKRTLPVVAQAPPFIIWFDASPIRDCAEDFPRVAQTGPRRPPSPFAA